MRIAIVTGASSGMGKDFAEAMVKQGYDSVWVIARRIDRLEELKKQYGDIIRPLPLDLTDKNCLSSYRALLAAEQPDVAVLVNCSGFGRFGTYEDIDTEDALAMLDLNSKALVAMTEYTLPYMKEGGQIYQLCSLSSFQPVPYLNAYAASKAYVLSYSRGLNAELKSRKIKVMAVCPGWVRTEFFDHATATDNNAVTYYNKIYESADVIKTALKDMKKGKDVSIHGFRVKAQVLLVKLLPHKLVMKIWLKQQKH